MPVDPQNTTYFRQARFTTRLPNEFLYAPSHYWLREVEPGLFRIGMTRFASRMLGDFVEISFSCEESAAVNSGEAIGEIEGFKAIAEVYCAASGTFLGANPEILSDPDLVDSDPYDRGWMYAIRGRPGEDVMDVEGYVNLLNSTIDRMLHEESQEKDKC
ncbi:MAG: glycine cleavage system protein H [Planctomycetaceae bacterium]|nr:glycine cleavage system protein H [Planctomycetaceae bacterium]MCA9108805.1 glycine cleavage system protein H [Planctomycetaceae bacterium]